MSEQNRPKLTPGGLVTVAYLKARLDEGGDQLGIFMPLVVDVLQLVPNRHFTTAEMQQALADAHGVAMPQETVLTLLKRLARSGVLLRDAGRFVVNPEQQPPRANLRGQKALLRDAQLRLGAGLRAHAEKRDLNLESNEASLDLVLRFLEEQQTALLLGTPPSEDVGSISPRESEIVAEFLYDVVGTDPALTGVLKGILEGLVLYHASFLPDLAAVDRHFRNLTVIFDSVLVRQALGFEGSSPRDLVRETIDLLKSSNVRCVVFDKTVQEIHRILGVYEKRLATAEGRRSLRQVAMARHFLTQRYSPSDVQEMSALLDKDIFSVGLDIVRTPARSEESTHGEAKLAERLADPKTHDVTEPRVLHDVDCVAGVLTLRGNHRSSKIEEVRAIFVTTAPMVISNTRLWWEEDERESGISPAIHVRALANLAWLKRPTANPGFQLRELVALCAAAMRPSQKTWQRFLGHLDRLQASQRLSTEAATAIIVSAMSDKLLREAESEQDDFEDIDAGTLDEVVERVMADYEKQANKRVHETAERYEKMMVEVRTETEERQLEIDKNFQNAAEELRRRDLLDEGRSHMWSRVIVASLHWSIAGIVLIGAIAVTVSYTYQGGWAGVAIGLAVVILAGLEVVGVLRHLRELRASLEGRLRRKLRAWFSGKT